MVETATPAFAWRSAWVRLMLQLHLRYLGYMVEMTMGSKAFLERWRTVYLQKNAKGYIKGTVGSMKRSSLLVQITPCQQKSTTFCCFDENTRYGRYRLYLLF